MRAFKAIGPAAIAVAAFVFAAPVSHAQDWPNRPVRLFFPAS